MGINEYVYAKAMDKALRVDFLTNSEELFLYADAIYSAMMWGKEIDEKSKAIREAGDPVE